MGDPDYGTMGGSAASALSPHVAFDALAAEENRE